MESQLVTRVLCGERRKSSRPWALTAVLIKGGHKPSAGREAVDVLLNNLGEFHEFREEFVDVGEIHGSGCTLSAAIASCLSLGMTVEEAVREAKRYVTQSIRALEKSSASATGQGRFKRQAI